MLRTIKTYVKNCKISNLLVFELILHGAQHRIALPLISSNLESNLVRTRYTLKCRICALVAYRFQTI
jgi:hypothetical protein